MSSDPRSRSATTGDPARDPARAATLQRLAGVTGPAAPEPPADPATRTTPVAAPPVPWADSDPDGRRPERVRPSDPDPGAWADPPWWRRVRWAPDRVAGIALVVLVLGLGAFSVHRLLAAVPDGPPVPDLALATPGQTVPADGSAAPSTSVAQSPSPSPTAVAAGGADQPVVVSVVGLVGRSGLVTVAPGARVADALDRAGGVLDGGDRDGLNLARRVVDGEQILVGVAPGPDGPRGPRSGIVGAEPVPAAAAGPATPAAPAAPGAPPPGSGPVNLNTADAATLDTLPGVGPVTAAAILSWRAANGVFASVDQLAEVDGVGPATLSRLRPLVTV